MFSLTVKVGSFASRSLALPDCLLPIIREFVKQGVKKKDTTQASLLFSTALSVKEIIA